MIKKDFKNSSEIYQIMFFKDIQSIRDIDFRHVLFLLIYLFGIILIFSTLNIIFLTKNEVSYHDYINKNMLLSKYNNFAPSALWTEYDLKLQNILSEENNQQIFSRRENERAILYQNYVPCFNGEKNRLLNVNEGLVSLKDMSLKAKKDMLLSINNCSQISYINWEKEYKSNIEMDHKITKPKIEIYFKNFFESPKK